MQSIKLKILNNETNFNIYIYIYIYIFNVCQAQATHDSLVLKARDLEIKKQNNLMQLYFDYKMNVKLDRDTIYYNKYEMNLPLLKIKSYTTSNQTQVLYFENGEILVIDGGSNIKNKTTLKKNKKWKLKKIKNKFIVKNQENLYNLLEISFLNLKNFDFNYIFENNWYVLSPENKLSIKEIYLFTNGIATIVVLNEGKLSKYLKRNINSFKYLN